MEAFMDWQRLARANTHPLRISVLEVLSMDGGRTLSPSDLSYELRVPLSNVNYHVTELLRSGLIELAGERQVRGATEHFYRMVEQRGNGHGEQSGNGRAREERSLPQTAPLEAAAASRN
jgi:predicted ArsR family transcriptional regulator